MSQRQGIDLRLLLALAAAVVVGVVVALLATGGGGSGSKAKTAASPLPQFESAGVLTPIQQAPPLALRNYLGQPVNISAYRGKAVFVTFIYTHCPDVCPLITSQLRVAQTLLGANASKAEMIAVSVDPRGDTRTAVASFLAKHQMTGRMQYLVGSQHELGAVWSAWGVGSERDARNPAFVNHSGLVYGISGSGKRITLYAPSFQPSEIAHDVPLLAAR